MSGKMSGQKVKLFVHSTEGKLLGGQRSATLNRSAETIDATSKSSEGNWTESVAGFKSWSVDADGVFVVDDSAYQALEQRFIDGEAVTVYLEFPSGNKYVGSTIITDASLEAPFDDLLSYSLSFQGTGALRSIDAGTVIVE